MNAPSIKILLIEDDEDDYMMVRQYFSASREMRFELTWAATYREGMQQFEQNHFSAILVDYSLGAQTGLDFVQEAAARGSLVPIILLTGQGNYEVDLEAMRAGAADYLTKAEVSAPLLERSIRYAIERKEIERRLRKDAERAELLANVSRDFAEAGLDYINLVNRIARRIAETTGDAVIIRLLADDGQTLEPAAAHHPDPRARDELLHLLTKTHLAVGDNALKQEPRLLCNASPQDLSDLINPGFQPWLEQRPADCVFGTPLYSHDRLIGTLVVIRGHPAGLLSQEEENFYLDLADRAAMAIENARLHQQVERLAVTDSLTGILNRRGIFQLGKREIERHRRYKHPLSVIMLDIDHFKTVNDHYGHAYGDEVLKELTKTCTAHIRNMDIAGRYGGDEFVILLPDTDVDTANKVADRIRTCFAQKTFSTDKGSFQVSASLGVTKAGDEIKDLDDLIKRADQALYRAKQKGRNRVESK